MYLFRMLEIGCIFLSLSGSFAQKVSYDFDKNAKFSNSKHTGGYTSRGLSS